MSEPLRPPPSRLDDFHVGRWLAEPALNRLTSGETTLRIRPQLMDVLVCLAKRQGHVVLKDELLAEVWPDRVITESGMVRCIAELRQLLGDDSREPTYIETISKRGYRLVAAVDWVVPAPGPTDAASAPPHAAEPAEEGPPPSPAVDAPPGPEELRPSPARRMRSRWWLLAASLVVLAAAVTAVLVSRRSAEPALTDRDTVVLAFENTTGDTVFDDTLPLALAVQLEQSPFLRILPDEQVRQTLGLMQRPSDTAVTHEVGAEVCERAGATALIVSSIAPLGRNFAIGLEAIGCADGAVLGRQQIEVTGKDEVLGGLGRIATALRGQLGESHASIQSYDVPITEATTASLEALRAVRRGDAARDRGQSDEALRFYREAVSLDPDFAIGHIRLGGFAIGQHYEQEGLAHIARAYELRDRVTLPERLEIDIIYLSVMSGDRVRMVETLEEMRRTYPRRLSARRRLATLYQSMGRLEDGLAEALEAVTLEPTSALAHQAVAQAYESLNRYADARRVAESAIAQGLDSAALHTTLLHIGFITGDQALVAREREWASSRTTAAPYFLEAEAEEAVWRGRLRESLEFLDRYQALARERGAEHRWTVLELRKARYEAICGFSDRAMARVNAQLAGGRLGNDLLVDALKVTVSAGDVETTARIIDGLDSENWPKTEEPFAGFVRAYRAAVETGRGRPERALEILDPIKPYELGLGYGLIPLHERALAHLAAGDWVQARDAFQKMLDNEGIFPGQKLQPLAQLGLARALAAGGQIVESRGAYEQFFQLWRGGDADLPLLVQARRELLAARGRVREHIAALHRLDGRQPRDGGEVVPPEGRRVVARLEG